jgi:anti-sigma factor RsiW
MNCDEARKHWMLYLDSEGDAELHLRVSDHLGMCPACAEWFARQRRFEETLAEGLARGPETADMWGRVLQRTGIVQPATTRRGWLLLSGALAAALVLWAVLFAGRPSAQAELAHLTVDCHERHLRGLSQVEFRSGDDATLEHYIHQHVPFPVHCPARKDTGFVLEGGGVCRWAPKPMVYFTGRVDQAAVSVFVLDRASLDSFPLDRERLTSGGGRYCCSERQYLYLSTVTDRNVVIVVGTAPAEKLENLLDTYGGPHGG